MLSLNFLLVATCALLLVLVHGRGGADERLPRRRYFRNDKDDFDYGEVVIVLSEGRSGSGFLCELISNVAGAPDYILRNELFGGNKQEEEQLKDPLLVLRSYLREQRESYPEGIIGIKWKPDDFDYVYQQVWEWVQEEGFLVVHNVRNQLDRYISEEKHENSNVPAHCRDEHCVEEEESVKFKVDPSTALRNVEGQIKSLEELNTFLDRLQIERLDVSYDKLTFGSDSSRMAELQRIADYVVGSGVHRVTIEDFKTVFEETSSSVQGEQVSNFDQVRKAFIGTEYEYLLRSG